MNTEADTTIVSPSSRTRIERLCELKQAIMDQEHEIQATLSSNQDSSTSCLTRVGVEQSVAIVQDAEVNSAVNNNRVKRPADFSSEDDGVSLSKYKKMSTEQKIINVIEDHTSDTSFTSDELTDESSDSENMNQEEKTLQKTGDTLENSDSSNDCNYDHPKTEVELHCYKNLLKTDLESDNSFGISPEKEIGHSELLDENDKQPSEALEKYILASTASKIHNHIIHTSQFSVNTNFEEENVKGNVTSNENDLNSTLKQSNSGTCADVMLQNTKDAMKQTDVPSSSVNEIPTQGTSNYNRTNINDDNASFVLEKNDSVNTDSQSVPQIMIPDIIENQTMTEASRASSVSDLNLAQMILGLRQDIQVLTKKVEKQENILHAVVHANEINLAPLFAQTFPEKYNLKLPFSTIEEFDKFNQDLAKDGKFCNEFITSLCSYIDNNVTLTKNILTMLRKYMSKELAMLYTASKATGNKMVLKDTLFCKCLLQATKLTIRNGLLPLEHEKAFLKNLGLVVSGAKNWHNEPEERRNTQR